eukprot:jgi/Chlat1/5584/Chrsp369S05363
MTMTTMMGSQEDTVAAEDYMPGADGVEQLVVELLKRRSERELAYALRRGLKDLNGGFSYSRKKGLTTLTAALREATLSPTLFAELQKNPELEVAPALIRCVLAPQSAASNSRSEEDPLTCRPAPPPHSPPADDEIISALHVLQGCCLLDPASRAAAGDERAVKVLVGRLPGFDAAVKEACLEALLALLLDDVDNQRELADNNGVTIISRSLMDASLPIHTRCQCAEFLHLLVTHVLAKSDIALSPTSEPLYTAAHAQRAVQNVIGTQATSVLLQSADLNPSSSTGASKSSLAALAQSVVHTLSR